MGEDGATTKRRRTLGERSKSGALATGLTAGAMSVMFHVMRRALPYWWAFAVVLLFVVLATVVWEGTTRRRISRDRPVVSASIIASAVVLVVMVAGFFFVRPWETPDPPRTPTGLSLASGNEVLVVSWDPSPSRDTFQFEYLLRWKRSSQSWDDATTKKLGDSTTTYTITGLTNDTAYNVWIEAQNLGGDSAAVEASATPRAAST